MDIERSIEYYDSHVQDLKFEDITSYERDAEIFRKLRDNDPDFTSINLYAPPVYGDEDDEFGISDYDDLGWLGYFIGRSSQLKDLTIFNSINDSYPGLSLSKIEALAQGISLNRSISTLEIHGDLGDLFLQRLGHFLRNNKSLTHLELSDFDIDYDKAVTLSSVLADLHSLKELSLLNNIGDDALQCLVAVIAKSATLEWLDLSQNTTITVKGLSSLSILLQSERCSLKNLDLRDMRIGDDGAELLAEALAGNKSLKRLEFSETHSVHGLSPGSGITAAGWSAFTRLLCDTSSINNTYLSNHTLDMCTEHYRYNSRIGRSLPVIAPPDVEYYLSVNRDMDHEHASMYKILSNHPEFDMKPLFQWQLKFLPLMVAWFKTARSRRHKMRLDAFTDIDALRLRELSAIYQFMRGLPSLAISGYLDQKMTGSQSKKRKQTKMDAFFNQVERPLRRRNIAREMNEQTE